MIVLGSSILSALVFWLAVYFYRRQPLPLPTGWEWRVLNAGPGSSAGASLFDQVAEIQRGWVTLEYAAEWRTSRGRVDGDMIDAMRHVERELAAHGWRV